MKNLKLIFLLIVVSLMVGNTLAKSEQKLRKKVDKSSHLTSAVSDVTEEISKRLSTANDKLQSASLAKFEAEKSLMMAVQQQAESSSLLMKADNEFQTTIADALIASQKQLETYEKLFKAIKDQKKRRSKGQVEVDTIALESAKAAADAWQNLAFANENFQEAYRNLNTTKIECDLAQIELYGSYGGLSSLLQQGLSQQSNSLQLEHQEKFKQLVGESQQKFLNLQQIYIDSFMKLHAAQEHLTEASQIAIFKQKEADAAATKINTPTTKETPNKQKKKVNKKEKKVMKKKGEPKQKSKKRNTRNEKTQSDQNETQNDQNK